jgi:hypothetical protein
MTAKSQVRGIDVLRSDDDFSDAEVSPSISVTTSEWSCAIMLPVRSNHTASIQTSQRNHRRSPRPTAPNEAFIFPLHAERQHSRRARPKSDSGMKLVLLRSLRSLNPLSSERICDYLRFRTRCHLCSTSFQARHVTPFDSRTVVKALVFYQPRRVCISDGYHGVHTSIDLFNRCRDGNMQITDIDDEFQEGDLCWLETPLNPTGESR